MMISKLRLCWREGIDGERCSCRSVSLNIDDDYVKGVCEMILGPDECNLYMRKGGKEQRRGQKWLQLFHHLMEWPKRTISSIWILRIFSRWWAPSWMRGLNEGERERGDDDLFQPGRLPPTRHSLAIGRAPAAASALLLSLSIHRRLGATSFVFWQMICQGIYPYRSKAVWGSSLHPLFIEKKRAESLFFPCRARSLPAKIKTVSLFSPPSGTLSFSALNFSVAELWLVSEGEMDRAAPPSFHLLVATFEISSSESDGFLQFTSYRPKYVTAHDIYIYTIAV